MALRDGMWAVLFTDLVGSTAQRARLGDEAGDALRREHDAVLAGVLATHRGERVSDTGDGAMCVFASSADAIAAGVALQQGIERRNRRAEEPLRLRVGMSAGELVVEGDGLMGMAAHEAARVCGLCEPGEVLISDLVRLMAGSRSDAELTPRGQHELKGLAAPVTVWEVAWAPIERPEVTRSVPNRLLAADAWSFAGREDDLATVVDLWNQATAGTPRSVFLSGEPGIGKTRLAAEVAQRAIADGALILYGQCDDDLGTPFLPFAEALGDYLDLATEATLGLFPGDLARLSARVRERMPGAPEPLAADAETEQLRLFDAVASWMAELAVVQPVVLVLDDLHWATKPTLLLFRHLLRHVDGARLLVLATYRDTDLDRRHPLSGMLGDFRRLPGVERISLSGLDDAGVLEFLHRAAGDTGGAVDDRIDELAGALRAETEGNPFFLGEVLRHLVESGALVQRDGQWTSDLSTDDLGLPQGVREVVGQRLNRLSEATNTLLTTGALVGREFTVGLLAEITGQGADNVLDLLDDAVEARLVDEVGPDHFRFAHALVRATLGDELGTSKRLRLHRRIAEALEQVDPTNDAALAHHWLEAADAGDPPRAIEFATSAGRKATAAGAYDEAADLYRRALDLCDGASLEEPRRELVIDLAEALYVVGAPQATDTALEAIAAARLADDDREFVRAAILLGDHTDWGVGALAIEVMTEALARTPDDMVRERSLLLARLAHHLMFEEAAGPTTLAEEALTLARELGDPPLFARVGGEAIHSLATPDNLERRLALAHELQDLVPTIANPVVAWDAMAVQPAWEAGDLDWVQHSDAASERLLDGVPFAYGLAVNLSHRAKYALFTGHVREAEEHAEELLARYGEMSGIFVHYANHIAGVRIAQGRAHELLDVIEELDGMRDSGGGDGLLQSGFAATRMEAGQMDMALAMLRAESDYGFSSQARDSGWFLHHAYWAEVAAELADRGAAEQLHRSLLPYVDRMANAAPTAAGSVARLLGRLEIVLGDFSAAEGHLAHAEERHRAWGARLYLARTWADQADLVLARDGGAGIATAQERLEQVRALAAECEAQGIDLYADRVLTRARDRGLNV